MDKLKMMTADGVEGNIEKIEALFPCCVTERLNEKGKVEKAIDFEMLKQELSHFVVDGAEERYQFTWPDKKKSILLANAPINKTLRPVVCDEQVPTGADSSGQPYTSSGSVGKNGEAGGFDSENLYIEGDNLDVLKLLQETYMGKIKMIYIDPPYNTGNDFVYEDDFSMRNAEFSMLNEDVDSDGNRMVLNAESNGRFHTDWLNMIYPRLKLAKDLLTDDGVIFISIDDNEVHNMRKLCDEVFDRRNFISEISWRRQDGQTNIGEIARVKEYILLYGKSCDFCIGKLPLSDKAKKDYQYKDEKGFYGRGRLREPVRGRYKYDLITPNGLIVQGPWLLPEEEFRKLENDNLVHWPEKDGGSPRRKIYLDEMIEKGQIPHDFWGIEFGTNQRAAIELEKLFNARLFDFPKPVSLIYSLIKLGANKNSIILDFFSGSATTAHAVMQLNAEDGGNRKFIMAQLPEITDEKSEAFKAGYKNICEIGKERIRRAGKKIADNAQCNNAQRAIKDTKQEDVIGEQNQPSSISHPTSSIKNSLDIGFRVLKLDTTNMKDVYYRAENYSQSLLDNLEGNIKADRKPQDLLLQVMLDMGVMLSSKIEIRKFAIENGQCVMLDKEDNQSHLPSSTHLPSSISHLPSYTVFIVGDYSSNIQPNLIACFDDNLSNELVTAIAKMKPLYAVFRDSSFANDSVATNFEQIFTTYSPTTTRKVL